MKEIISAVQEEREWKILLSARISHEFRTPMSIILTSAELLEFYGQRLDEEKRLEHLKRIQEAVLQMTNMLTALIGEC